MTPLPGLARLGTTAEIFFTMKLLLLAVTVAFGLCTLSSLEAQTVAASKTSRKNSTATATGTISRRNSRFTATNRPTTKEAIISQPNQVDGVVPRAIRSGNPLQIINPFAPANRNGDDRAVTRRDPSDPYQRPEGIKLVTIEF